MASTHPLISKSSIPFTNPLRNVPSALITIGTAVIFMFHGFFSSIARSRYLFFFSLSFNFTQWIAGIAKSTIRQVFFLFFCLFCFFLLTITKFVSACTFPEYWVEWHHHYSK